MKTCCFFPFSTQVKTGVFKVLILYKEAFVVFSALEMYSKTEILISKSCIITVYIVTIV